MIKKLLALLLALFAATVFAAIEVNTATPAELDSVKGIGPAISAKIVDARKNGPFKDWEDLVSRVKGIGEKNSAEFSAAGLTVNGSARSGAPATATATKKASKSAPAAPATTAAVAPSVAPPATAAPGMSTPASAPMSTADKKAAARQEREDRKAAKKAAKAASSAAAASGPAKK